MVLYSELPIYRDSYELLLNVFRLTNSFSHEYKYSLGQDMKRDALALFRHLYHANRSLEKSVHLDKFLEDFELLKLEIRVCMDLKLLPLKKMAQLSLLMDSIGKQTTAWRNRSKKAV